MKPELVENHEKMKPRGAKWVKKTAKWSKMDQKWSQEEQKLEADRTRWPKTAPKSRPGGPTRAIPYSRRLQNGGQNPSKSMKKSIKDFSYRFFFDS